MKAKLSIFVWGLIFVDENYLNRMVQRATQQAAPSIYWKKISMNKSSHEMDPWIGLQGLVIWRRLITFCGGMWNYLFMLINNNRLMHSKRTYTGKKTVRLYGKSRCIDGKEEEHRCLYNVRLTCCHRQCSVENSR